MYNFSFIFIFKKIIYCHYLYSIIDNSNERQKLGTIHMVQNLVRYFIHQARFFPFIFFKIFDFNANIFSFVCRVISNNTLCCSLHTPVATLPLFVVVFHTPAALETLITHALSHTFFSVVVVRLSFFYFFSHKLFSIYFFPKRYKKVQLFGRREFQKPLAHSPSPAAFDRCAKHRST